MVEIRDILKRALAAAAVVLLLSACTQTDKRPIAIESYSVNTMGEDIESDAETDSIISIYRKEMHEFMSVVIGESDHFMEMKRPESDIMRYMSSAILEESILISEEIGAPTPVMSMLNAGGIRTTLPQGKITVGNVFEVSPFENSIVMLSGSGSIMKAMMEHIIKQGGEAISGAQITVKGDKIVDCKIAGEEIDPNKTYTIATNNYVADGGDGFEMLRQCKRVDTNLMIREMLIEHIKKTTAKGEHIVAPEDVRITVLKEDE